MKNDKAQELKPVYIHEASYSTDDSFSLIDIAMALLRHKTLIAVIIISFIALGVTKALLTPKSYTFSASIEIGSQLIGGAVRSFESPQTLLAKLQHSFIPQVLDEYRKSTPSDEKKYKLKALIPSSSDIIVLEIVAVEEDASLMKDLLINATNKAIHDHSRIYNSVKRVLESRLKQANSKLENLGSGDDNRAEKAGLQDSIEGYSSQLANLRNTHEISPPMQSLEPTGTSRKLVVILATFIGLFISLFAAFFAEFTSKVRNEINNQATM